MTLGGKVSLGLVAGAGIGWAAYAWLRSRRRIDLEGRVVVITGGTSGHGLMVARQAAAMGAKVVIAARNPAELRAAEEHLREHGARAVLAVPTDVTDPEQARALIARTMDHFGRIDVLINNAGIISVGPLETMNLEDFRAAMSTNFWGAAHTTLAALPHMRRQKFGRIGNVGSIGSKLAMPHLLPYTASKFALAGFTDGLRAELVRENIYVTGIYPSTMRTGGHTHAWFKGDKEAEYAWFGASDTIPGVAISAEAVARRLIDAVCHGDAEVILPWPAKAAVFFRALMPNWTAELLSAIDRTLPPARDIEAPPTQGQFLEGKFAEMLNKAIPPSSRPGSVGG